MDSSRAPLSKSASDSSEVKKLKPMKRSKTHYLDLPHGISTAEHRKEEKKENPAPASAPRLDSLKTPDTALSTEVAIIAQTKQPEDSPDAPECSLAHSLFTCLPDDLFFEFKKDFDRCTPNHPNYEKITQDCLEGMCIIINRAGCSLRPQKNCDYFHRLCKKNLDLQSWEELEKNAKFYSQNIDDLPETDPDKKLHLAHAQLYQVAAQRKEKAEDKSTAPASMLLPLLQEQKQAIPEDESKLIPLINYALDDASMLDVPPEKIKAAAQLIISIQKLIAEQEYEEAHNQYQLFEDILGPHVFIIPAAVLDAKCFFAEERYDAAFDCTEAMIRQYTSLDPQTDSEKIKALSPYIIEAYFLHALLLQEKSQDAKSKAASKDMLYRGQELSCFYPAIYSNLWDKSLDLFMRLEFEGVASCPPETTKASLLTRVLELIILAEKKSQSAATTEAHELFRQAELLLTQAMQLDYDVIPVCAPKLLNTSHVLFFYRALIQSKIDKFETAVFDAHTGLHLAYNQHRIGQACRFTHKLMMDVLRSWWTRSRHLLFQAYQADPAGVGVLAAYYLIPRSSYSVNDIVNFMQEDSLRSQGVILKPAVSPLLIHFYDKLKDGVHEDNIDKAFNFMQRVFSPEYLYTFSPYDLSRITPLIQNIHFQTYCKLFPDAAFANLGNQFDSLRATSPDYESKSNLFLLKMDGLIKAGRCSNLALKKCEYLSRLCRIKVGFDEWAELETFALQFSAEAKKLEDTHPEKSTYLNLSQKFLADALEHLGRPTTAAQSADPSQHTEHKEPPKSSTCPISENYDHWFDQLFEQFNQLNSEQQTKQRIGAIWSNMQNLYDRKLIFQGRRRECDYLGIRVRMHLALNEQPELEKALIDYFEKTGHYLLFLRTVPAAIQTELHVNHHLEALRRIEIVLKALKDKGIELENCRKIEALFAELPKELDLAALNSQAAVSTIEKKQTPPSAPKPEPASLEAKRYKADKIQSFKRMITSELKNKGEEKKKPVQISKGVHKKTKEKEPDPEKYSQLVFEIEQAITQRENKQENYCKALSKCNEFQKAYPDLFVLPLWIHKADALIHSNTTGVKEIYQAALILVDEILARLKQLDATIKEKDQLKTKHLMLEGAVPPKLTSELSALQLERATFEPYVANVYLFKAILIHKLDDKSQSRERVIIENLDEYFKNLSRAFQRTHIDEAYRLYIDISTPAAVSDEKNADKFSLFTQACRYPSEAPHKLSLALYQDCQQHPQDVCTLHVDSELFISRAKFYWEQNNLVFAHLDITFAIYLLAEQLSFRKDKTPEQALKLSVDALRYNWLRGLLNIEAGNYQITMTDFKLVNSLLNLRVEKKDDSAQFAVLYAKIKSALHQDKNIKEACRLVAKVFTLDVISTLSAEDVESLRLIIESIIDVVKSTFIDKPAAPTLSTSSSPTPSPAKKPQAEEKKTKQSEKKEKSVGDASSQQTSTGASSAPAGKKKKKDKKKDKKKKGEPKEFTALPAAAKKLEETAAPREPRKLDRLKEEQEKRDKELARLAKEKENQENSRKRQEEEKKRNADAEALLAQQRENEKRARQAKLQQEKEQKERDRLAEEKRIEDARIEKQRAERIQRKQEKRQQKEARLAEEKRLTEEKQQQAEAVHEVVSSAVNAAVNTYVQQEEVKRQQTEAIHEVVSFAVNAAVDKYAQQEEEKRQQAEAVHEVVSFAVNAAVEKQEELRQQAEAVHEAVSFAVTVAVHRHVKQIEEELAEQKRLQEVALQATIRAQQAALREEEEARKAQEAKTKAEDALLSREIMEFALSTATDLFDTCLPVEETKQSNSPVKGTSSPTDKPLSPISLPESPLPTQADSIPSQASKSVTAPTASELKKRGEEAFAPHALKIKAKKLIETLQAKVLSSELKWNETERGKLLFAKLIEALDKLSDTIKLPSLEGTPHGVKRALELLEEAEIFALGVGGFVRDLELGMDPRFAKGFFQELDIDLVAILSSGQDKALVELRKAFPEPQYKVSATLITGLYTVMDSSTGKKLYQIMDISPFFIMECYQADPALFNALSRNFALNALYVDKNGQLFAPLMQTLIALVYFCVHLINKELLFKVEGRKFDSKNPAKSSYDEPIHGAKRALQAARDNVVYRKSCMSNATLESIKIAEERFKHLVATKNIEELRQLNLYNDYKGLRLLPHRSAIIRRFYEYNYMQAFFPGLCDAATIDDICKVLDEKHAERYIEEIQVSWIVLQYKPELRKICEEHFIQDEFFEKALKVFLNKVKAKQPMHDVCLFVDYPKKLAFLRNKLKEKSAEPAIDITDLLVKLLLEKIARYTSIKLPPVPFKPMTASASETLTAYEQSEHDQQLESQLLATHNVPSHQSQRAPGHNIGPARAESRPPQFTAAGASSSHMLQYPVAKREIPQSAARSPQSSSHHWVAPHAAVSPQAAQARVSHSPHSADHSPRALPSTDYPAHRPHGMDHSPRPSHSVRPGFTAPQAHHREAMNRYSAPPAMSQHHQHSGSERSLPTGGSFSYSHSHQPARGMPPTGHRPPATTPENSRPWGNPATESKLATHVPARSLPSGGSAGRMPSPPSLTGSPVHLHAHLPAPRVSPESLPNAIPASPYSVSIGTGLSPSPTSPITSTPTQQHIRQSSAFLPRSASHIQLPQANPLPYRERPSAPLPTTLGVGLFSRSHGGMAQPSHSHDRQPQFRPTPPTGSPPTFVHTPHGSHLRPVMPMHPPVSSAFFHGQPSGGGVVISRVDSQRGVMPQSRAGAGQSDHQVPFESRNGSSRS